jgi:hypothetical protein
MLQNECRHTEEASAPLLLYRVDVCIDCVELVTLSIQSLLITALLNKGTGRFPQSLAKRLA